MKPLHLNLASNPWQNSRPFWITVGIAAAVIVILLVNNVQAAWRYYVETEETRVAISEIQARTTAEMQESRRLQDRLETMDRDELMQRVDFVNKRIVERTFSWSQLIDHLERVLPNDVRLTTLRPSIDDEGPILSDVLHRKGPGCLCGDDQADHRRSVLRESVSTVGDV